MAETIGNAGEQTEEPYIDPDVKDFLEAFGGYVPEAELPEDSPVPVDLELVRKFYRHELPLIDEEWVADFIAQYRPWRRASLQVILEEAEGADDDETETPDACFLDMQLREKLDDVLGKDDDSDNK